MTTDLSIFTEAGASLSTADPVARIALHA